MMKLNNLIDPGKYFAIIFNRTSGGYHEFFDTVPGFLHRFNFYYDMNYQVILNYQNIQGIWFILINGIVILSIRSS